MKMPNTALVRTEQRLLVGVRDYLPPLIGNVRALHLWIGMVLQS